MFVSMHSQVWPAGQGSPVARTPQYDWLERQQGRVLEHGSPITEQPSHAQ
jgi:hypothetical protein